MIEPTETESKQTLDAFAEALLRIAEEARHAPETVQHAPKTLPVTRLDEVKAAREPDLRWKPGSRLSASSSTTQSSKTTQSTQVTAHQRSYQSARRMTP